MGRSYHSFTYLHIKRMTGLSIPFVDERLEMHTLILVISFQGQEEEKYEVMTAIIYYPCYCYPYSHYRNRNYPIYYLCLRILI